jgi:hypothetical protein
VSAHHGANSFFEAAAPGIPPVVVAPWYDTYEWAAPGVNAEKSGLVPVVGAGKEAEGSVTASEDECGKFGAVRTHGNGPISKPNTLDSHTMMMCK